MKELSALTILLALSLQASPASGGTDRCQAEINRIERLTQSRELTPEGNEMAGAKLHRQPTPESVGRATKQAWDEFDELLASARALDAKDDTEGCMKIIRQLDDALAPKR